MLSSDRAAPDFSDERPACPEPTLSSDEEANFDSPSENLPENLENSGDSEKLHKDEVADVSPMFFSQLEHSFVGVRLEAIDGEMEIPTEPFLLASGDFLPILDKLGKV